MCRCIVSRQGIKCQEVFFVLNQATHRLGIAFAVFGFEGRQLSQGLLLCGLLPNANEFSLNLTSFSSGDGNQLYDASLHTYRFVMASIREQVDTLMRSQVDHDRARSVLPRWNAKSSRPRHSTCSTEEWQGHDAAHNRHPRRGDTQVRSESGTVRQPQMTSLHYGW